MPANNDNIKYGATFYDVIIRFLDILYNLIETGRFGYFLILFIFMLIYLIVYKLPASYLEHLLDSIFSFIKSEKLYLIPLNIALGVSFTINYYQARSYRRTVKRLLEEKDLIIQQKLALLDPKDIDGD